jgi:hypothetical protein
MSLVGRLKGLGPTTCDEMQRLALLQSMPRSSMTTLARLAC